ncbi:MAG TPA: hypothetical protein VET30_08245 [Pseudoxanthomonas sp.]|nr:hypothetical protein [Pseudoxanthomonas sp.]
MNKPLPAIVLATLLLAACNQPADTPAPPVAAAPATDAVIASIPASSPAVNPVAPSSSEPEAAPAVVDDKAVDAAIDKLLGDHARYKAVISAYQQAVTDGDKIAVAALVAYPFNATVDGKRVVIKDAAGFIRDYDRIVTPAIASVIKAQEYSALMVNSQGVMFGSGETWINGICSKRSADCSEFEVKVVAIQPGGTP